MKLGSHNSFTYLPVRKWWMRPFRFMARCQEVAVENQIELGVRFFDLRVKFVNNRPIICHGIMQFGTTEDIGEILTKLHELANKCTVYCRLVLEQNHKFYGDKQLMQEALFRKFCVQCLIEFPKIFFVGGNRKFDWRVVYEFMYKCPPLIDAYSSTTSWFNSDSKFLAKLDDWYPRLYAKYHNKESYKKLNDNSYLFLDFVNIK